MKDLERSLPRYFRTPIAPKIKRPLYLKRKAAREVIPYAEIDIRNKLGEDGQMVINVLTPHIPGYPAQRKQKGMERWLRSRGLIGQGEWLVPSRTAPLNRAHDISGETAQKMLADIGAYQGVDGTPSLTKANKRRWSWGEAHSRRGGTVKGIWNKKKFFRDAGAQGALAMVVAKKQPTYQKRFPYASILNDSANRNFPKHIEIAVGYARRRRGL
jgi:hypothetical protein